MFLNMEEFHVEDDGANGEKTHFSDYEDDRCKVEEFGQWRRPNYKMNRGGRLNVCLFMMIVLMIFYEALSWAER